MATTKKPTGPPKHLSRSMQGWWRTVARDFDLEAHQLHLLRLACEAYDRFQGARVVLDKDGTTYLDRFRQPKLRPEAIVERDARRDFAALVKALGFPDPPDED